MILQAELDLMVEEHKTSNPFYFEGQRDSALSLDEINRIKIAHGVRFPEAYVHHLTTHGAREFALGWIYSPDPASGWSLWKDFDGYIPHLRSKAIPISDNGCGDYYCFPIIEDICEDRIVWADHEKDFVFAPSDFENFRDFILNNCLNAA